MYRKPRVLSFLTFLLLIAGFGRAEPAAAKPPVAMRGAEIHAGEPAYSSGDVVLITGAGFAPTEVLAMRIEQGEVGGDSPRSVAEWNSVCDAHGTVASSYEIPADALDGVQLRLTASGLASGLAASTTFTVDAKEPSFDARFAASGTAASTQLQAWFNKAGQWGGTVQSSNSRYSDGDTLPLRFTAALAAGSTHTFRIKYDFSSGGAQRFFDSLRSYDASAAGVAITAGVNNTGSPLQFPIPIDASLPAAAVLAGNLTAYNISSLSFGAYTLVDGVKTLPVTFTVASGGTSPKNVILAYGGHLAAQDAWGSANGAATFPGASRKAYAQIDKSSTYNVSVNPGSIVTAADLAVSKTAAPDPVLAGELLTYNLTVRNLGPDVATGVTLTDPLPAGTTFISATASQGTFSGTSTLNFSLGSLGIGSTASITIQVRVATGASGVLANTATVSGENQDPISPNNSATANSNVTPKDSTPPQITCADNITTATSPGLCTAIVNYTVTATDDRPGVSLVCNPSSGSSFPKGTTTVECTATDAAGNIASCTFTVTVLDLQPPSIQCPAAITVGTDPGKCTARVTFSPSISDDCPGASAICSPPSGSDFPIGTTTVNCVATDASGNTANCSFDVTVRDIEAPTFVCTGDVVAGVDPNRCDAVVNYLPPGATDNCDTAPLVVCTPPPGSSFPLGETPVICTATDATGNVGTCSFTVTVQDVGNVAWPHAVPLGLINGLGYQQASYVQCLTALDQSRWFKFKVQPGSRVIVTLTSLPENYDLVLFKDIAGAYQQLLSPDDLLHLSAEFAADAFSPAAFSGDAFSPAAFAPAAFSPAAFSPAAFSPAAFSPAAFSPAAFSPAAFSPDAYAPAAFSPAAFSPAAFSPAAFSPAAFSPAAFSPAAFSAAQIQSVIAVSAFDGTAGEGVIVNTWDNAGDFYIRVRGRNGVFSPGNPFNLDVFMLTGACSDVSAAALDEFNQPLNPDTVAADAGGYKTIILTDLDRWLGAAPSATKTAMLAQLNALAARPEVQGVVVDVGADPWVAFFNQQADTHYDCPYAKNLVAEAIKGIIDRSRLVNPLEYVVLIGGDAVIPFFRHPDEALLGPERNYVPPVRNATASEASLRLGYVLSQDAYGADCGLSLKTGQLPLPGLAVGRLVETAPEVAGMLDAYLATADGVAPPPTSALVSGYDFLADAATAVAAEFQAGLGAAPDALISPNTLPPALCWSADDLRDMLFSRRHDLLYLAGHFSANSALAADYVTYFRASELADSTADFVNSVLFSAGCHSGYNIVDADGIPFVTLEPDWTQACARKQATLIAGTGYQYGDTDFIEYSERLYLEFARQLRSGAGPIAVGKALADAKRIYLAGTPQMRGIHTKAYLEATLFGLPMLSVNLPGPRLTGSALLPTVGALETETQDPGLTLGLQHADLSVNSTLTPIDVTLTNPENATQTVATYLSGGDGVINNPAEPILPLELRNVSVTSTVLRGVGLRSGAYTDLLHKVPLTGAATTEIRGVHASFLSEVFYPIRPWSVNYFGALCGGVDGVTRLMVVPAQFMSDSPTANSGTLRQFSQLNFRLFYCANVNTYDDGSGNLSTPSLAAAPAISAVQGVSTVAPDRADFSAVVVGNPAAGIQGVWITYTALSGPFAGQWQSLDLAQGTADTRVWTGQLPLAGTPPEDFRFIIQAVNGVGVVAADTKLGAYHELDEFDVASTAELAPTRLAFLTPPSTGRYGEIANFAARLTDADDLPLAGRRLIFKLGDQEIWATTDVDGQGTAALPLRSIPASYDAKVVFRGAAGYAPSSATSPFTLTRQTTDLTIAPTLVYIRPNTPSGIVATLMDGAGGRIIERTLLFVVLGPAGHFGSAVITDLNGRAPLGTLPLPAGEFDVTAYFNGVVPLPGHTVSIDDGRYQPASTAGIINVTLIVDDQPPLLTCPAPITVSTAPGRCAAEVTFAPQVSDDHPGTIVICTPPSGSTFPKGTTTVHCTATDAAGNTSNCSFTVTVEDHEAPVLQCPTSPISVSSGGAGGATVTFTVTATDNCPGVTVVSSPASGSTFPIGTTSVHSVATDNSGNQSSCDVDVVVSDSQPPAIQSLSVTPNLLRPPNHHMVDVVVTVLATDNSGNSTARIISIASNEPVDGTGDGDQTPDWLITGPLTAQLRSERAQNGTGRIYTITVEVRDAAGNTALGNVTVFVPKN